MAYISPSINASGTRFAQFQARGASGHLEALIAANMNGTSAPTTAPTVNVAGGGQTLSNPANAISANANGGGRTLAKPSTAVTLSATGGGSSGGSLPAGTYYVANTWVTACGGETTLGSSQASVAVTAGQIPSVTIPALPAGAAYANIYVGTTTGVLFKYKAGVTGTVALLDSSTWFGGNTMANAPGAPTINTTVGILPPGTYYAAVTQYNAAGETTVGSSTTASAFTVTTNSAPGTAPTGAGSGSSGGLTAGAYYYRVSYVDINGNETTGTENASATTITANQSLVVTFNDTAPDWVVSRNLYLTLAGGASGSETLYATGISPTASTYICSSASWVNGTVAQSAARAVITTATSASVVPQLTLPGPATGALDQRVYLSNTNGTNTALALYATGVTATAYNMTVAPWNGSSFAVGVAPPVTNTTSGNLAAATYYLRHTELNGFGETTVGPESSSFTVAAGNIPQVTFPALQAGNVARNLYLTPAGGSSGSELLYADGITTGTYNLAYAAPFAGVAAPTVAPTIATGTTYGGYLAPGTYYLKNTELNGAAESLPGPESSQFTVAAQSAPSTPTVSVGGSGGNLVAGTYYMKATNVDAANGSETTPSTESAQFTIAAGQVATVTLGALPTGIASRNLYCTPVGGASGTETLYATGITGSTYSMTAAYTPTNTVPPTINGSTTNQPLVTPPTLQPGNSYRNFYLTPANGSSGTEVLYAAMVGTSTLTLSGAAPVSNIAPPAVAEVSALAVSPTTTNTTGLTNSKLQLLRYCEHNEFQRVWNYLHQVVTVFNQGEPASQQDIETKFHDVHVVFAMINQLCVEEGALIDANPGHITSVKSPIGTMKQQRVWP
jgi:hypothetical protein